MLCDASISASATVLQVVQNVGCQCHASANVTAIQMLAMGCQYICQCKCYSYICKCWLWDANIYASANVTAIYANVGYAMPMPLQMLLLCNRWLWSQVLRVANYHVKCCVVGMRVLNCASDGRVGWVRFPY